MEYKAYFFDFDGVLADSVAVKTKAFASLFEMYGHEIMKMVVEHHENNGGMSRYDKFRYYFRAFLKRPLSDEGFQKLCDRFSELVVDEVVASAEILGVNKFLTTCSAMAPCFVISATPQEEIREIVDRRGLSEYFKDVLGAPVSKAENLKTLLNRYGFQPQSCLFLGDAESDYLASIACKVDFIGIVPGLESPLVKKYNDICWAKNFNDPLFSIQTKNED